MVNGSFLSSHRWRDARSNLGRPAAALAGHSRPYDESGERSQHRQSALSQREWPDWVELRPPLNRPNACHNRTSPSVCSRMLAKLSAELEKLAPRRTLSCEPRIQQAAMPMPWNASDFDYEHTN